MRWNVNPATCPESSVTRHRERRGVRVDKKTCAELAREQRVHPSFPPLHRPSVVPPEERFQDRAELLDPRLLGSRAKIEHRARAAVSDLKRPAAAADEVSLHVEVEPSR